MKNFESKQNEKFNYLVKLQRQLNDEVSEKIGLCLKLLKTKWMHYFLAIVCCSCIANSFSCNPSIPAVAKEEQEEIINN